jgi:GTP-binding protein
MMTRGLLFFRSSSADTKSPSMMIVRNTARLFSSAIESRGIKLCDKTSRFESLSMNSSIYHLKPTFHPIHVAQPRGKRISLRSFSTTGESNAVTTNNNTADHLPHHDEVTILNENEPKLIVSILGPANAGKSTLFNRIMCKESNRSYRLASDRQSRRPNRSKGRIGHHNPSTRSGGAIVSPIPGTTRDRRECIGRIGNVHFKLVDTAGVDGERISLLKTNKKGNDNDIMEKNMMQQTLEAAKQSDLILLMFDAKVGLTQDLAETAQWLRKLGSSSVNDDSRKDATTSNEIKKKVVVLANKLEGDAWLNTVNTEDNHFPVMDHLTEVLRLGFGEAIPISAEHGEGLADIAILIEDMTNKKRERMGFPISDNEGARGKETVISGEKPLQLAILGRQNVGKSTLVNALLNQDRVISGATPGLTRDSISINWSWNGRPVQLVDTAGIRRMVKRDPSGSIEDMAVRDAMRAMKVADVAVLVLDAEARMLQRQELAIADAVVREGRALIVAANKMDLLVDSEYSKGEYATGVRDQIENRFPMLRNTPVVAMSSLTGESVEDLMPIVFNARDRWAQKIGTGLLNRWVEEVLDAQPPPMQNGRPVRIKYLMQTKGRPPTFLLFCNVEQLPVSYMRYLTRNFQESFQMFGMEVRMAIKKNDNPFEAKKKSSKAGMGLGGVDARKKRTIQQLKTFGRKKKKGQRRQRMQRTWN